MKPFPARHPDALYRQTGGTLAGVILGLLVGLVVALGVAMYVTKAPMPFAGKSAPQAPAANVPSPAEGATPPDPNTLLLPKEAREFIQAPSISVSTPGNNAKPDAAAPSASPAAPAAAPAAGATAPAVLFFLETGRFRSVDDAEQMRVRLVLASVEAQVVEVVTDSGSPFRVRVGPFATAEDAYRARTRITENGFEARLVKVSR
jgi:cell division protein FtsN